jgi:hypothetical protein
VSSQSTCLNCNRDSIEGAAYCIYCGQALHTHRFNFRHIFHEFFHAFTHTDKTVFGLISGLAVRPGVLVREYLGGKRKKYFNPFTFLLLVAAFSILVLSWAGKLHSSPSPSESVRPSESRVALDPQTMEIRKRAKQVGEFMNKRQNLVMLIAVPFIALVYFLAYKKMGLYYAEHMVANVFFNAFVILFSSVIFYPLLAFFRQPPAVYWVLIPMLFSHVLYYTLTYGQLLQAKGWVAWARVFLVSVLAVLLWSSLTRLLIGLYIRGF